MGIKAVWQDEFLRAEPMTGAVVGEGGEAAFQPPVVLASPRNGWAGFQLLVGPIGRDQEVAVAGGMLKGPGSARIAPGQFDIFVQWHQKYDNVWHPEVCVPQEIVGGSTPDVRRKNGLPAARIASTPASTSAT